MSDDDARRAGHEVAEAIAATFREALARAKFKRPDLDAEITRLTARIAELEKALRDVAEAKMPGQARYIARTTLEASGGE